MREVFIYGMVYASRREFARLCILFETHYRADPSYGTRLAFPFSTDRMPPRGTRNYTCQSCQCCGIAAAGTRLEMLPLALRRFRFLLHLKQSTPRDDAIHKNRRVSNSSIWATYEIHIVVVSAYSKVLEIIWTQVYDLPLSHWSYTKAIATTHIYGLHIS